MPAAAAGHDSKAHPQLHLGSLMPAQYTALELLVLQGTRHQGNACTLQDRENTFLLPTTHPQVKKPRSVTSRVTSELSRAQPLVRSAINYPLLCRDKCLILWLLTLEVNQSALGWIRVRGTWLRLWSPHHVPYTCSLPCREWISQGGWDLSVAELIHNNT